MNSSGDVFLGIDGGGTRTTAVLVDRSGQEIARAVGTTSNPSVIGFDAAARVLVELIANVTDQVGVSRTLTKGWAGLSGFGRASDQAQLRPILSQSIPDLHLTNDVELVLAALPQTVGVALIAGTGSIAAGRNAKGEFARVGGWGHLFGDEGSGYDLGRQTLHAVARQIDGRSPQTTLTDLLFEEWNITDPYEIISRAYDPRTDKAAIARLARFPLSEVFRQDQVSIQIVESAAMELATMIETTARRLGFDGALPLALTGGIMIHHLIMRETVLKKVAAKWDVVEPVVVIDPALAAARSFAGFRGIPT